MFLALYTTCVIISIGLLVHLIVSLILQKRSQVVLCTECRQCMAVCPLLEKGCNPMEIMLAAKCGRLGEVMAEGGHLCVCCSKCQKACPRGLAPFKEVEKWRSAHNPEDVKRRLGKSLPKAA